MNLNVDAGTEKKRNFIMISAKIHAYSVKNCWLRSSIGRLSSEYLLFYLFRLLRWERWAQPIHEITIKIPIQIIIESSVHSHRIASENAYVWIEIFCRTIYSSLEMMIARRRLLARAGNECHCTILTSHMHFWPSFIVWPESRNLILSNRWAPPPLPSPAAAAAAQMHKQKTNSGFFVARQNKGNQLKRK